MERRGAAQRAAILRAFSNTTRLQILEMLMKGKYCVKEVSRALNYHQPNISQHLALLKSRGLVYSRRRGFEQCYEITKPKLVQEMFGLITHLKRLYRITNSRALAK